MNNPIIVNPVIMNPVMVNPVIVNPVIVNPVIVNPVIVALDVESAAEARKLVASLGSQAGFFKVGLELYAAAGMDFVRELKDLGHRVFLDLKLYDIGETVKRAVAQVARAQADFLTLHGSRTVMQAAVEGRGDAALKLLAVTVLTNLDESDLRHMGYSHSVAELVDLRARNAVEAGVDGLICSALDVARVRAIAGPRMILVTPGVRSGGALKGDQKRVATPAEAIANGANYLVIGRQITRSPNPPEELARILEEITPALAGANGR